jgi:hypothetical protein
LIITRYASGFFVVQLTADTTPLLEGLGELCRLLDELTDGAFGLVYLSPKLVTARSHTTVGTGISVTLELSESALGLLSALRIRAIEQKLKTGKNV